MSRLLLPLLLLAACGGSTEPPGSGGRPVRPSVLLVTLDTLRADHTGFGGYEKPTTPFLDTLAAEGVVFDNHFANSNCTLPSHATMLTGLHYASHGVRPVGEDLEPLPPPAAQARRVVLVPLAQAEREVVRVRARADLLAEPRAAAQALRAGRHGAVVVRNRCLRTRAQQAAAQQQPPSRAVKVRARRHRQ